MEQKMRKQKKKNREMVKVWDGGNYTGGKKEILPIENEKKRR